MSFVGGLESPLDKLVRERQEAEQRALGRQPISGPETSTVDVAGNIAPTIATHGASHFFGTPAATTAATSAGEAALAGAVAPAADAAANFGFGAVSGMAPALAAAPLAAATVYNTATGIRDILQGNDLNFGQEAALALPTFGASFLIDPIRGEFGSGKNPEQRRRDAVRDWTRRREGVNQDGTFASLDGQRTLQFEGPPGDPARDPLAAEALSLVNPIAIALGGDGDPRNGQAFGNILAGAIRGGATTQEELIDNARGMMNALGVTPAQIFERLEELKPGIDETTYGIYLNSLQRISGMVAPSHGSSIQAALPANFDSQNVDMLQNIVRASRGG